MNKELLYPARISFAGIDEHTDINELIRLTEYGEQNGITVEFGVLLSGRNGEEGNNRYPSINFMKELVNKGLNLSLHLCGKYTGELMKHGTLNDVKELLGEDLYNSFQRIQVNVVGRKTKAPFLDIEGKEIIIQTNTNEEYSNSRLENYISGENGNNVVFLSDVSGGKGERGEYQCYGTPWQGYAGGITPENVLDVIEEITAVSLCRIEALGVQEYWLDLESGCRENEWFSVDKCRELVTEVIEAQNEKTAEREISE